MQALESLNDNQVNDFLSGKSPLNLSVRLGDHMMLIQLQLSTLSPSQQNSLKQKVANAAALKQQQASKNAIINCSKSSTQASTSQKRSFDDIDESAPEKQRMKTDVDQHEDDSKSPIKSLSSMVSSPLTTTVQNMNQNNNKFWAPTVDPIAANLTSCLCKRLNISCNNNCGQRPEPADDEPCCSYSNNIAPPRPIPFHQRPSTSIMIKPKQQPTISETVAVAEVNPEQPLLNTDNPALAEASRNLTQTLRKLSKRVFTSKTHLMENSQQPSTSSASAPPTSGSSNRTSSSFSSSSSSSNNSQAASVAGSSGAVIESMKHHGKGIYSGTFSGTLNPALQDKNGRPKRDISTIIHILNDLLSATPQCARNGAKIFFEPTQTSSGSTGKFIKVRKTLFEFDFKF